MKQLLLIAILLLAFFGNAQKENDTTRTYVQFSGFTIDAQTYEPVPYIIVYNKNLKKSTLSDAYGFFSFVASLGDTILFRSVTFKQSEHVIPNNVKDLHLTHFQEMEHDVTLLNEAIVRPYATKEALAYAFVYEDIPDDDLARAYKNINNQLMMAKGMTIVDANLNYRWAMQNHINKTYYAGQLPPNNLLNPIAWVSFFKMLKDGQFKIQP
jgi:hypothetical protein